MKKFNLILKAKYRKKVGTGKSAKYFYRKKKEKPKQKETKQIQPEKKKSDLDLVPVKGLNADLNIDFKANFEFLNKEIEGINIEFEKEWGQELKDSQKELDKLPKKISMGSYEWHRKESIEKNIENIKKRINERNIKNYEEYSKNLTPIHTLNSEKFMKVLKSGGLMSLEELKYSGVKKGKDIIEEEIGLKYDNRIKDSLDSFFDTDDLDSSFSWAKFVQQTDEKYGKDLLGSLNTKDWKNLIEKFEAIEQNIKKAIEGAIAYKVDKEIQTNRHVFSLMGSDGSYGDIALVLKQDIMKHPDFNMTPTAGTSFVSGEMYNNREWADSNSLVEQIKKEANKFAKTKYGKLSGANEDKFMEARWEYIKNKTGYSEAELSNNKNTFPYHFHKSKLNAGANEKYYEYMAKDIAAQGSIKDYETKGSHGKWEAHLPAFVPLNMIEEVVMDRSTYEQFNMNLMSEVKYDKYYPKYKSGSSYGFRSAYDLIQHQVGGTNPLSQTKEDVIDHLKKKQKENPEPEYAGMVEAAKLFFKEYEKLKKRLPKIKISDNNRDYLNKQFNKGTYRRIHK